MSIVYEGALPSLQVFSLTIIEDKASIFQAGYTAELDNFNWR